MRKALTMDVERPRRTNEGSTYERWTHAQRRAWRSRKVWWSWRKLWRTITMEPVAAEPRWTSRVGTLESGRRNGRKHGRRYGWHGGRQQGRWGRKLGKSRQQSHDGRRSRRNGRKHGRRH